MIVPCMLCTVLQGIDNTPDPYAESTCVMFVVSQLAKQVSSKWAMIAAHNIDVCRRMPSRLRLWS